MEQIYVALLDENVDVWRPVKAEKLGEKVYLILKQTYDRSTEKWEFEPGEKVICEYINPYFQRRKTNFTVDNRLIPAVAVLATTTTGS